MKLDMILPFWMKGELKFPLKSLTYGQDEDYLCTMACGHMMDLSDFMNFNRVRLRDGATVVLRHYTLPDREYIQDFKPKSTGFVCDYKFKFAAELHLTINMENPDELTDTRKREIIKECFAEVRKNLDGRTIKLKMGAEFTLSSEHVPTYVEIDHLIEVHGRWKENDIPVS